MFEAQGGTRQNKGGKRWKKIVKWVWGEDPLVQ